MSREAVALALTFILACASATFFLRSPMHLPLRVKSSWSTTRARAARNSVRVMSLFTDGPGADPRVRELSVVLTGGARTPSDALGGPVADLTIRSLHLDTLFLGCHGIDPTAGLTTPNLAEAETNRAFVKAARKVTVIADHTKWGIVGLSSFADLDDVDTLITDARLPDHGNHLSETSASTLLCPIQRIHFALAADETSEASDGGSLQTRAHRGRADQLEDFDWLCHSLHRDRAERAYLH